jgi:hypothetical protein
MIFETGHESLDSLLVVVPVLLLLGYLQLCFAERLVELLDILFVLEQVATFNDFLQVV